MRKDKKQSRRRNKGLNRLAATQRADGAKNLLTGSGTASSKSGANVFSGRKKLSIEECRAIYEGNGIGSKIITKLPFDMTRRGFCLKNDSKEDGKEEDKLLKFWRKHRLLTTCRDALEYARAYGGAVLVLRVDDGGTFRDPLNINGISSIEKIEAFERGSAEVVKYYNDTSSPKHGEPEVYSITNGENGAHYWVHESRVIRVDGATLSRRSKLNNAGWNASVLQRVYDDLMQYLAVVRNAEDLTYEASISVLKMDNLFEMSLNPEDIAKVRDRLRYLDETKSNHNTVAIDGTHGEEFTRQSLQMSGMNDLLKEFKEVIASATPYPLTELFGASPGGLNATGQSDRLSYYATVEAHQEADYEPLLRSLFEVVALSKDVGYSGSFDDVEIVFNALHVMTEAEEAEVFDKRMSAAEKAIRSDVYTPEEVAMHYKDVPLLYSREVVAPDYVDEEE